MTITAKFASTCQAWHRPIRPGDQVEWQRGSKATHTTCPTESAQAPVRTKRTAQPKTRYREPMPDEVGIAKLARLGAYAVGSTLYVSNVRGGGGPDGHYWTVTHTWHERANEDLGNYEPMERAYVVPATDDQAAPVATRRAWRTVSDVAARVMGRYPTAT